MSRRQPAEEGLLFDLPLDRPAGGRPPADPPEQAALPLSRREVAPRPAAEPAAAGSAATRPAGPPLRLRLAAGLVDLGACLMVILVLLAALWGMEIRLRLADLPAAALFLLVFSFLYQVLPLAFWGRTPGMASMGLEVSTPDGQQLTIHQTVLRWLGSVLTLLLAGLPLLLVAVGGRSLSDLLSRSLTRRSR